VSDRDAVIVGAVRTAVGIGKPDRGALRGVHPVDLAALVIEESIRRSGIDPDLVDDVVLGCVSQIGEQSFNVARNAALGAGLPEDVTGVTIDRQCGSSQQALHMAAAAVIAGQQDVVVAGGVEVMSRVPMFSSIVGGDGPFGPMMKARYDDGLVPQGISAEMIAARWGLSREYLDSLAVASHERAAAAAESGLFDEEILVVDTPDGPFGRDQGIRPGTSLETLSSLRTVF
jgi:acetyl-CoA acyltransferase